MIFGIGVDIVQIERIAAGIRRFGDRLAHRVLTNSEFDEYCGQSRPAAFLAKRFAAKEAVAKALGHGFRNGVTLRQIGIGHDDYGKPALEYYGAAHNLKEHLGISDSYISLADEKCYAIAYVVLMKSRENVAIGQAVIENKPAD